MNQKVDDCVMNNENVSANTCDSTHFVGVDISMKSFHVALLKEKRKVLWDESFSMDQKGFKAFYQKLQSYPNCIVGMESTSTYHLNLLLYLLEKEVFVVLLNPMLVKRYISSQTLRNCKTDKADAAVIASFLKDTRESLVPYTETQSHHLFRLARCKEEVTHQITAFKTKLKQLLRLTFPELVDSYEIYATTLLQLLTFYPSAQAFCKAGEKKIDKRLLALSKGKGKPVSYTGHSICSLAQHSIGHTDSSVEFVIQQTIQTLQFYQMKKNEVKTKLEEEVEQIALEEVQILSSIPGIGKDSAVQFMAEINHIGRFRNHKALTAYIGTDPGIEQSGQSLHRKKISKRGNASLRRLGFIVAQKVIQYCPRFQEYYQKKRGEGMAYKKAVIAVWNKLLRMIFSMLQRRTYFVLSDS
jgi:transposase